MSGAAHTFSVAPMMDWTDRHERFFLRLLSRRTTLYTEMITTGALIHGDAERFLKFHPDEHPVAIQLGGSDPADLARCAKMAAVRGYDEVNLNVGCPSDRVQAGRFGACLMLEPRLVADCVDAMASAVDVPVTVKSRIGVDEQDSFDALCKFVEGVAAAGCQRVIIHARKAWLTGLSPKENREIPPLKYDVVYAVKQQFPHLEIVLNGGVETVADAKMHLDEVDGVMMGRAAYQNPWVLSDVDCEIFGDEPNARSRSDIILAYLEYVEREFANGVPVKAMTRHLMGLFNGVRGARAWRRYLSENAPRPDAAPAILRSALSLVEDDSQRRRA